jgi:hypothetical protein
MIGTLKIRLLLRSPNQGNLKEMGMTESGANGVL